MGFVKVGSGKEGRSVSWALLKLHLCLVKRYDILKEKNALVKSVYCVSD